HGLIGALARKNDRDVIPRKLRKEVERNTGRISHRLVQMRNDFRYRILEVAGIQLKLVMFRPKMSSRFPRESEFVPCLALGFRFPAALPSDAEGIYSSPAGNLAHHRQH